MALSMTRYVTYYMCDLLGVWPWESYLNSVRLGFLVGNKGIMIYLPPRLVLGIKLTYVCVCVCVQSAQHSDFHTVST